MGVQRWKALIGAAALLVVVTGGADRAAAAGLVNVDATVGTDIPVAVSGGVVVQLPFWLRASTSLGVVPGGYVDLINDAVQAIDSSYGEAEAALVRSSLETSMVWRTTIGIKPLWGFYAAAGYALASLGGGLTTKEALDAAALESGRTARWNLQSDGRELKLGATVHLAVLELGWEQVLFNTITLRGALGYTGAFAADVKAEPSWTPRPIAKATVDELTVETETYLRDTITSYVHTPVLSLAVGYRFF